MAQYALEAGGYSAATLPSAIGNLYNIGLSDGTRYYGYIFQNQGQQSAGFVEKSDVATKSALQNYGSSNLTDRDLVFYPRSSQGDFSGGMLQVVALDQTKYYNSDLDTLSSPGYVFLRPAWGRRTATPITVGNYRQVVAFNNDFWFSLEDTSNNIYTASGGVVAGVGGIGSCLDTDGQYLYVGNVNFLKRAAASGNTIGPLTTIASAFNGSPRQYWVVNQGTNGIFAYYAVGNNSLYKIDLTAAFPVAAGSQAAVPTGSNNFYIVDLVAYQNGIAILTNDVSLPGFTVWYHDGTNMTAIQRMPGYKARGLCNCLGDMYIGAQALGGNEPPILCRVSSGSFEVVVRAGSLALPSTSQECLQPRSTANLVYWPVLGSPFAQDATKSNSTVLVHDTVSGHTARLPIQDNLDFGNANSTSTDQGLRNIATLGNGVAAVFYSSTTGYCQYQSTPFGSPTYTSNGWLVSSNVDFATPGIPKRFRRIEVHHAPLTIGQSITVKAFVDQDPINFTTTLTPNPSTATVTHSYNAAESSSVASVTTLTFGQDTVGRTLYYAVQLNAGATNTTTPRLAYVAIEVGGVWTWDLYLDCSNVRRLLNDGSTDGQGVSGKDLAFLLRNAYENGTTLTAYLAQSVSYSAAIESLELTSVAYSNHQGQQPVKADEEWLAHVVLRQVA